MRVPANTHTPLMRSGSRSTTGHEDQSIIAPSYHWRFVAANVATEAPSVGEPA